MFGMIFPEKVVPDQDIQLNKISVTGHARLSQPVHASVCSCIDFGWCISLLLQRSLCVDTYQHPDDFPQKWNGPKNFVPFYVFIKIKLDWSIIIII